MVTYSSQVAAGVEGGGSCSVTIEIKSLSQDMKLEMKLHMQTKPEASTTTVVMQEENTDHTKSEMVK